MRKIWIIIANWIISPYWYVMAIIINDSISKVQQGTLAPPTIFDIIAVLLLFFYFLPPIMLSLFIHNTIAMVVYYCISGGLIWVVYCKYKELKEKRKNAKKVEFK